MKNAMRLSELEAMLSVLRAKHGDIGIYINDMEGLEREDLHVVGGADVLEPELYGAEFLHLGFF